MCTRRSPTTPGRTSSPRSPPTRPGPQSDPEGRKSQPTSPSLRGVQYYLLVCLTWESHLNRRSISPAAFPNPPTTSGVTVSSFQIHNILLILLDSSFHTLCVNDMKNSDSLERVKFIYKAPFCTYLISKETEFLFVYLIVIIISRFRSHSSCTSKVTCIAFGKSSN